MNKFFKFGTSFVLAMIALLVVSDSTIAQSPPPVVPPTVVTTSVSGIGATSATLNGNVTASGGATVTERGFQRSLSSSMSAPVTAIYGGSGTGVFSAVASSLTCGTTYYFRAYAKNSVNPTYGVGTPPLTFTTSACPTPTPVPTPSVSPPTLAVPTATPFGTVATLSGNITNTGGANATIRGFNYGPTTAYGTTISSPAGSYGTGVYTIDASSLTCGTTYHFRAYATNSAGPRYSVDNTFTTSACPTPTPVPSVAPIVAPTLSIPSISGLSATQVTMSSNITNTGGANATTRGFEFGPTTSYGTNIPENGSFSTGVFSTTQTGLACATLYHYRAYATNSGGTTGTIDQTFTTSACPTVAPTVTAQTPTLIGQFGATLNGNLTAIGSANVTERGFEYDKTTSYTTLVTTTASSYPVGAYSSLISGLDCGTLYYFRAYARNSVGIARSAGLTFTTSACPAPPTMANKVTVSNVTRTSVTLSGEIASGTATERGFEYGTEAGVYTASEKVTGSFGAGAFSMNIVSLTPGKTYYFRAYAKNLGGTNYSAASTFATNVSPTKLSGWAWSSNIGLVNLEPIVINQTTGNFEGYAWSSNIGWIKFDGLSNYPTNGSAGGPAKVDLDSGIISGWIRACAGTVGGEDVTNHYGANCSSMTSRTDGWDGWIELAGVNHQSVVAKERNSSENLTNNFGIKIANAQTPSMSGLSMDLATGVVSGMAWGGPVIGWINFNAAITPVDFAVTCNSASVASNKVKFTAVASGGNGNYEYSWNGGPYSTTLVTKEVIYSTGPGVPVTVPLSVREVGGTSVITPVLGCSYTPPVSISASCSMSDLSIVEGESSTASIDGAVTPAGSYRFEWMVTGSSPVSTGSTPSFTRVYNTPGVYKVSVRVIDQNSGESRDFMCTDNLGVSDLVVATRGVSLSIGKDGDDAALHGRVQHTVKKGQTFGLAWENTLSPKYDLNTAPEGYRCDKTINGAIANWNSGEWSGDIDPGDSNMVSGMTTANSDTGIYKFAVVCTSGDFSLTEKIASTTLKIFTATGSEI